MVARSLLFVLLLVTTALATEEETGHDGGALERTGLPRLCAERFADGAGTDRCVEHQLAAGRRIRKLLLANPSDAELETTIEGCAARAVSPVGTYDWIGIEDCVRAWARTARR